MGIKKFFTDVDYVKPMAKRLSLDIAPKRKGIQIEDCKKCKLYKEVNTPRMEPHGDGRKKGLVIAEAPGEKEDKYGYQLHPKGKSGELIRDVLDEFDIDLDKDCITVNAVDCRPPDNREPRDLEIKACYPRKERIIKELKPKAILLLGRVSVKSFYGCSAERSWFDLGIGSLRGKCIPDMNLRCWVCHSHHSAFILRGNTDKLHVFKRDIKRFADCLKKDRPNFKDRSDKIKIITDFKELKIILEDLYKNRFPVVFDYETSSYRYYENIHKIYIVGFNYIGEKTEYLNPSVNYVFPIEKTKVSGRLFWTDRQLRIIKLLWKRIMRSDQGKIAQNIRHEHKATRWVLGYDIRNWHFDTMIGNRVMDESRGVNSLKIQTYINFGYPHYGLGLDGYIGAGPKLLNKMDEVPLEDIAKYCAKDVYWTRRLFKKQPKLISSNSLDEAYQLMHDGTLIMGNLEDEGVRLNIRKAKKFEKEWSEKFQYHKDAILNSREAELLKKKTGRFIRFNKQTSRNDLLIILFDILKIKSDKLTNKSLAKSVDEEVLNRFRDDYEFIENELRARKYLKMLGFLNNFLKYEVDGFIHPSFLLDVARTYRSSSREPNFQNVPKRDEESSIIRSLIIPRKGHLIYEVDYSSMEVRILACWSEDPVLCKFVEEGFDMHGYWAEKLFRIKKRECSKEDWKLVRYAAKNGYVFANFYGSYYKSTANGLLDQKLPDLDVLSWSYKKWENHVRKCENEFWDMFSGVREKQYEAVKEYKRKGYLEMIGWGFRRHGYLKRNEIFNTHIQGPAFLCLLWSLVEANRYRNKWESKLCGQIHDSIFIDVKKGESAKVMETMNYIMIKRIRRKNKWLKVSLETEWEKGRNWNDMKEVKQ